MTTLCSVNIIFHEMMFSGVNHGDLVYHGVPTSYLVCRMSIKISTGVRSPPIYQATVVYSR